MRNLWIAVLVVWCALVAAGGEAEAPEPAPLPATTRAPPRTLDRKAAELAWRSWLQSPESGNQNAPPRRITTKSLFITPLVCQKGQRLDRNGCVQVVTVDKNEHERILLEQLNALFTAAPNDDVVYDYGDDNPGPLQLSIPIGLDPQAAPLTAQEPEAQAQEHQPNYVTVDKKDENKHDIDASIEAELELLKLQHSHITNDTWPEGTDALNHVLNTLQHLQDKPKRDSPVVNSTESGTPNNTEEENSPDKGQKEVVYGHVNVDPILIDIENPNQEAPNAVNKYEKLILQLDESLPPQINATVNSKIDENNNSTTEHTLKKLNKTSAEVISNSTAHVLKKDGDQTKLNPENDYADIGEAIKLISRYAEVTTDDNFSKHQKKPAPKEDSVLGTRTKLQHRRNKPKPQTVEQSTMHASSDDNEKTPLHVYPKNENYYRYPWQSELSKTPPPNYPFRHLQDYWPGRNKIGGVYNTAHENPRRHHHNYPQNYFRPHGLPYAGYPRVYPGLDDYPRQLQAYNHRTPHHANLMRSHSNNQDLYSLLGLRHWFSSEGASKR